MCIRDRLSLTVTGTTYLVGLLIGTVILTTGVLDSVQLHSGAVLNGLTDLIFDPIVDFFSSFLPGWSLFFIGLGIILVSFNLFDRCLPEMSIKAVSYTHLDVYKRQNEY